MTILECRRWFRTTLDKCVTDAIDIKRPPALKQEELIVFVNSLLDRIESGHDSTHTGLRRHHVRHHGGMVPRLDE